MALNIVMGPSGSGKTHSLFEFALKQAKINRDYNYLVIVPEQYTLSTQLELVNMSENHGILNVDVLSFARLCFRIFEEVGYGDYSGVVMDDMGKNLILRHLANENNDKLKYLSGKISKLSYITEIKSVISEFKQYRIKDEEIDLMIEKSRGEGKNMLAEKLADIKVLYDSFNDYIKEKYTTSEEILELASKEVFKSKKIKKSVVIFDGFTGFTPVQYGLIEALLQITPDIYVSLLNDERDNLIYNNEHELFYLSYETKSRLEKIANKKSICINKKLSLNNEIPYRYSSDKKRLIHLEKNLFREYKKPYFKDNKIPDDVKKLTKVVNDEIRVATALNPTEEIRNVAVQIKKMVKENNYRYKDIAIATGDLDCYTPVILREFAKYDIPVFTDRKNSILLNPFSEYLRSVLEIATSNWRYEAVFRYLRSALNDYKTDDIDILENFVLAKGIRGYSQWNEDWTKKYIKNSKKISENEKNDINNINNLREKIVNDLCFINNLITQDKEKDYKKPTKQVNEINAEILRLFEHNDIEKRLLELSETIKITDDNFSKNRGNEFEKVYAETIKLMNKMDELLGDEIISLQEYSDLIDAGFDEIRVGIIPGVTDYIQVGDITRSRFKNIHALFIVGVNDGVIPQGSTNGGIISDIEKEFLINNTPDIELSPTSRMKTYSGQLYIYMLMTKPDEKLFLSYSRLNMASETTKPSYIINMILDLFPDIKVERDSFSDDQYIYNEETAIDYLCSNMLKNDFSDNLLAYFGNNDKYKATVEKLVTSYLNDGVLSKTDEISKAVANVLYSSTLKGSVTRLERFAECAYRYFLEYGLKLKERELFDFDVKDMGILFHKSMENYSKIVTSNNEDWISLSENKRSQYITEAINQALNEDDYSAVYSNFRKQYVIRRVNRILDRSVSVLTDHLKAGKFKPIDVEVAFSSVNNLSAFNFQLSDTERMHLSGSIDRLDTFEDDSRLFIKIIDYKSGKKSFDILEVYKGLSLQLVVYLNAAKELLSKDTDKEIVPAGILYYHVDDPIVESSMDESNEAIAERIFSSLKMNGLVNSDENVYRLIDEKFEKKSNIIPVSLNKDNLPNAYSSVAAKDDFDIICSYVEKKMCDLGKEILSGNIAAKPNSVKGTDPSRCGYCPYVNVCKFNADINIEDETDNFSSKIPDVIELMKADLGENDQE